MARKVPPQKPSESNRATASTSTTEKAETRALELPKGAMIAFRKTSGDNAVEFFVYPNGRISFNTPDFSKEAYEHPSRKLNDAQINHLRHLLDQVDFYHTQTPPVKPSENGTAYEISARVGSKANAIQLSESNIPDGVKPLIEELNALLPKNLQANRKESNPSTPQNPG